MNMQKALIVFFLLAVGMAFGFLAGRETSAPLPPPSFDTQFDTPEVADAAPVTNQPVIATEEAATTAGVEPAAALRMALAAIPEESAPRGHGVISGQIKDDDGAALANVLVRVVPNSSVLPDAPKAKDDEPIDTVILNFAKYARIVRGGMRTATTDGEGRYQITDLAESSIYDLEAHREGWSFSTKRGGTRGRAPGDTIDFVGRQVVKVPIQVTFADGTVPPHASVRAKPVEGSKTAKTGRLAWNPDRTELELRPGTYVLTATESKTREFKSEEVEITVELGVIPDLVTLVFVEQPGIRGRVSFADGTEPDSVTVRMVAAENGNAATIDELLDSNKTRRARAYSGYDFRFIPLDPGTYTVGVQHNHNSPVLAQQTVVVNDAIAFVDLVVPVLQRDDYLALRVLSPSGSLVRDYSATLSFELASGSRRSTSTAIKNDDGSRLLLVAPPRGTQPSDIVGASVKVSSKEFGTKTVTYLPGETASLDVAFEEPARLQVTIAGYVGSGYEDKLTLRVTSPSSNEHEYYGRSSYSYWGGSGKSVDEHGSREFGPLEPGEHTVILSGRSEGGTRRELARQTTQVTSGLNHTTIAIPALYTLRVHTEQAAGTRVRLYKLGDGSFSQRVKVDSQGLALFDTLVAGDYNLYAADSSNGAQMTVQVPAQQDVTFTPTPPNAVLVTITGPGGSLEEAGFVDGDIIYSAGNEPVAGLTQLRGEAQKVAAAEARLVLQLRRGSRQMELDIDPSIVLGNQNRAGRFDSIHAE
ncbi:MAG: hypothetical protein AAF581_07990 [Planctomycetota bacterium]